MTDKQSEMVAELRGPMWSRLGAESQDQAQMRRIKLTEDAADELERLQASNEAMQGLLINFVEIVSGDMGIDAFEASDNPTESLLGKTVRFLAANGFVLSHSATKGDGK
jgi:hypothetical protein